MSLEGTSLQLDKNLLPVASTQRARLWSVIVIKFNLDTTLLNGIKSTTRREPDLQYTSEEAAAFVVKNDS